MQTVKQVKTKSITNEESYKNVANVLYIITQEPTDNKLKEGASALNYLLNNWDVNSLKNEINNLKGKGKLTNEEAKIVRELLDKIDIEGIKKSFIEEKKGEAKLNTLNNVLDDKKIKDLVVFSYAVAIVTMEDIKGKIPLISYSYYPQQENLKNEIEDMQKIWHNVYNKYATVEDTHILRRGIPGWESRLSLLYPDVNPDIISRIIAGMKPDLSEILVSNNSKLLKNYFEKIGIGDILIKGKINGEEVSIINVERLLTPEGSKALLGYLGENVKLDPTKLLDGIAQNVVKNGIESVIGDINKGNYTKDTKDILIAYAKAVDAFKKAFEEAVLKANENVLIGGVSLDYLIASFQDGKLNWRFGITTNFAKFGEGADEKKTAIVGVYMQGNINWSRESGAVLRLTAMQDLFMAPGEGSILDIYAGGEQRLFSNFALAGNAQAQIAKYANLYRVKGGLKYYPSNKLSFEVGYGGSLTKLDVGAKLRQLDYRGEAAEIIAGNIPDEVLKHGPYVETNIKLGEEVKLRAGGSVEKIIYGPKEIKSVTGFISASLEFENWEININAIYSHLR